MDAAFTLVCKMFPGSPLHPVRGSDGKCFAFATREEAEEGLARVKAMAGVGPHTAGGGPYYFVAPVQSSTSK